MANQVNMIHNGMYNFNNMPDKLPRDFVPLFSYHIQQLISEVGEVLDADKRWKNLRNSKYNRKEKLDEIADCFIVLMNVAIFSGFNADDVLEAIASKLEVVAERIDDAN